MKAPIVKADVAVTVFVGMLIAVAIVFLTLSAMDEPPLVYPTGEFTVQSPIKLGDPQYVQVHRCNTTDEPLHAVSTRILVSVDSGERWSLNSGSVNMQPGCEVVDATLRLLPDGMTPGTYYLQTSAAVQGRLRLHVASHRSNEFEVIE